MNTNSPAKPLKLNIRVPVTRFPLQIAILLTWTLLLIFQVKGFAGGAPQSISLPSNGVSVLIGQGKQAWLRESDKMDMVLLLANRSSGLSGEIVKYSLVSGSSSDINQLDVGDPRPRIIIKNWNGDNLVVTNLSTSGTALLDIRLYSGNAAPDVALSNDFKRTDLKQYQTAGGQIASNSAYLQVGAPFEKGIFIIFLGNVVNTIHVNAKENDSGSNEFKTQSNVYNIPFNNQIEKRLFIINASQTPTVQGYVAYKDLTVQGE